MENKEKSFGEILFDANKEFWSMGDAFKNKTWETLEDHDRETYDYCGNKLIQYYENYILDNFLNKYKPEEK